MNDIVFMNNYCKYCHKFKTYDPWCCKEALNAAVKIYLKCTSKFIYQATGGLLGDKE